MLKNINMTYTLITRSIVIYFLVFILLRIMGKRQIGEMQPFELVITLIIADLATIPMAETALPLVHGIIPIVTLAIIHFALTFLSMKSLFFRKLINGKPIIVVKSITRLHQFLFYHIPSPLFCSMVSFWCQL